MVYSRFTNDKFEGTLSLRFRQWPIEYNEIREVLSQLISENARSRFHPPHSYCESRQWPMQQLEPILLNKDPSSLDHHRYVLSPHYMNRCRSFTFYSSTPPCTLFSSTHWQDTVNFECFFGRKACCYQGG